MERVTTKINKELVLSQLAVTKGNRSQALNNVNIGRTQFYEWLKTDEEFRKKFIEVYKGIKTFNKMQQLKQIINVENETPPTQQSRDGKSQSGQHVRATKNFNEMSEEEELDAAIEEDELMEKRRDKRHR